MKSRIYILLIMSPVIAFFIYFMSADRAGYPVHYVIPDGFHGVFLIRPDPASSIEVLPKNGIITLHIPKNGLLELKDDSFLEHWHTELAYFESGRILGEGSTTAISANDSQRMELFSIGTSDKDSVYFVGTGAELLPWRDRSFNGMKPGLITPETSSRPAHTAAR